MPPAARRHHHRRVRPRLAGRVRGARGPGPGGARRRGARARARRVHVGPGPRGQADHRPRPDRRRLDRRVALPPAARGGGLHPDPARARLARAPHAHPRRAAREPARLEPGRPRAGPARAPARLAARAPGGPRGLRGGQARRPRTGCARAAVAWGSTTTSSRRRRSARSWTASSARTACAERQGCALRSIPSVATRSSWSSNQTRWQESMSVRSTQPPSPARARQRRRRTGVVAAGTAPGAVRADPRAG